MANAFWFDDGALTLTEEGDTTEFQPVGLRGITVTATAEHERFDTADSTLFEFVKRHTQRVDVEINYAKFPLDMAQTWLAGGGGTATATQDNSDVAQFNMKVVATSADKTVERTLEVTDIDFPEFEFLNGSENEYEEYTLSGTGKTVGNLADTSET